MRIFSWRSWLRHAREDNIAGSVSLGRDYLTRRDCNHILMSRPATTTGMNQSIPVESTIRPEWNRIPAGEWAVYRNVLRRATKRGIPLAFGGAFATAEYTGELRNTKDFDIYIRPVDRAAMIQVMTEAGLTDHFDRLEYDRSWIYRASHGDVIVDAIWAMANQRAEVDEDWLTLGPEVSILGEPLRAIPIEEL